MQNRSALQAIGEDAGSYQTSHIDLCRLVMSRSQKLRRIIIKNLRRHRGSVARNQ